VWWARNDDTSAAGARAKILQLLGIVSGDIQLKADQCRHSADGLGRSIQILVRTKHGGDEVSGYEVWFVQNGFYGEKSAYDRFRKQSSPTDSRGLPPGGYTFWLKKGETAFEVTQFRIGGRGETNLVLEVEAP
jgi:hypothetical protein